MDIWAVNRETILGTCGSNWEEGDWLCGSNRFNILCFDFIIFK